jgi:hypothetical protein
MEKKPELVKIRETEYKCSCGDWKWELNGARPNVPAPAVWQKLLKQRFSDHVRQAHPREDFSQAAARIVREATERD